MKKSKRKQENNYQQLTINTPVAQNSGKHNNRVPEQCPTFQQLIVPTYDAIKNLGGEATNNQIVNEIIQEMNLSDEIVTYPHNGSNAQTELVYQAAWARTYLKNYGAITNPKRSLWKITPAFENINNIDAEDVIRYMVDKSNAQRPGHQEIVPETEGTSETEENILAESLGEAILSTNIEKLQSIIQQLFSTFDFRETKINGTFGSDTFSGVSVYNIGNLCNLKIAFVMNHGQKPVDNIMLINMLKVADQAADIVFIFTTSEFQNSVYETASRENKFKVILVDRKKLVDLMIANHIGVKEIVSVIVDL